MTSLRAGDGAASGKPWYKIVELVVGGRVGHKAFHRFLGYLYAGKL